MLKLITAKFKKCKTSTYHNPIENCNIVFGGNFGDVDIPQHDIAPFVPSYTLIT